MFMRLLQCKIKPEVVPMMRRFYETRVIPELQALPGCHFARLVQSSRQPGEFISMTLWDSREQADAYASGATFQKLMKEIEPHLSDSSEWKIQLSDDLTLQYSPIPEETVVKSYKIAVESQLISEQDDDNPRVGVRIVSLKIQEGKAGEFRHLYNQEIIPALKNTPGCRYAYLMTDLHSENEFISVTIWDSPEHAEAYEKSGRFQELVERVKHTFSNIFQWKMALEKDFGGKVKSSEEITVSHYNLVAGKKFNVKGETNELSK